VDPSKLPPDDLNRNLVYAGLFLLAFELVRDLVTDRVRGFYADVTFGPGMPFRSYEKDVLSLHKNVFEASLLYLRDHFEAIRLEDIVAIQSLRKHRNDLAHRLPQLIAEMDPAENERLLIEARESLFRLSNFWTYIDIGSDPEFTSLDIDWTTVAGGDLMLLDQIIDQTRSLRTTGP
jgi:hypothetical protein